MRLVTLCVLFLLNISRVSAQSDSVNFSRTEWASKRIAPGVHLKSTWFRGKSLFKSNQFIAVIEVKKRSKNKIGLAFEPKVKLRTSDFAKRKQAVAAINGTFFDVKNGGSVDFIRSNGQVINNNRLEKDSTRAGHQRAALAMNNGSLKIEEWDGTADWEQKLTAGDVMLTGPLLLHNNQLAKLDSNTFNVTRHPRSVIAITNNNRVLMITVDGRDANSAGLNLFELRKVLQWMHCKEAVNLDGGGSTTLWEKADGVVNHPSDNKKWDHEGQRKVANVLLLKRGNN